MCRIAKKEYSFLFENNSIKTFRFLSCFIRFSDGIRCIFIKNNFSGWEFVICLKILIRILTAGSSDISSKFCFKQSKKRPYGRMEYLFFQSVFGGKESSVHSPYLKQLEFYLIRNCSEEDKGVIPQLLYFFDCLCLGFVQVS